MRPDQHKQKKNLQYKKKHGISTKNKENKGQDHGNRKVESHSNQEQEDSLNVSDSEQADIVSKPSFRRRKLASNWDRYAPLPPEDEDVKPQQIGVDFVSLLSQTADSLSQFRFKDEKEWEDEKTFNSTFVALNCEKLAESLQCIPLHERLSIPTSLFSSEQIEDFIATAAAEKAKYVPDCGSTILQEVVPVFSQKTIETILSSAFRVPETEEKWIISPNASSEISGKDPKDKSMNQTEMKETTVAAANSCKSSQNIVKQCETEVDSLLSMGNSKTDINGGDSQLIQNNASCKQSMETLPKKTDKHYVSAATSSLEDWLDSVLED